MNIRFTKMHSLGNDFMVVDGVNQAISFDPETIKQLSNRHTGIGFDQLLLLEASVESSIDFHYRIYNADGSEVGQCGNGARCLARFIDRHRLSPKKKLNIATGTTQFSVSILENSAVVHFSPAQFEPAAIPMVFEKKQDIYPLVILGDEKIAVHALSVGNPHAVLSVDSVDKASVERVGKAISQHALFPEGSNVEFIECVSSTVLKCRVYERGCGETQACGSGAVAAAVVGRSFYGLSSEIQVILPGGELTVSYPKLGGEITLCGPAAFVYEGILM